MVILPYISGLKLCPAYFTTSRSYIGFKISPYMYLVMSPTLCNLKKNSLEIRIFTNSCLKGPRKSPKLPIYPYL